MRGALPGNRYAQRKKKRIDIGWLNCTPYGCYRQVRSPSGGGTRTLYLDKDCSMADVKTIAVNQFFPGGKSKLGHVAEFDIELCDFKGDHLEPTSTLEYIYKSTNLKIVKVHLYTKKNETNISTVASATTQIGTQRSTDVQTTTQIGTQRSTDVQATAQIGTQSSTDVQPTAQIGTQRSTDVQATAQIGTQRSTDVQASAQIGTQKSTDVQATAQIGTQRSTDVQPTAQIGTHTPADASTTTLQPDTGSPDLEVTFHPRHISRLSKTRAAVQPSLSICSWRGRLSTAEINLIDSSDDEDIQTAIEASLNENVGVSRTTSDSEEDSTKNKEEILLELNSVVDRSRKKNMVNVTRENVIEGAIRAFQRRSFDPCADLHVKFVGEDGIDDGGLTREFMRLLKKEISQQPMFVGKDGSKMLALHAPSLDKGLYKVAGEMLAYMMVHKGPTPDFFHPFTFEALSKGLNCVIQNVENVQDEEIREQLQKIDASTTATEFFEAVEPLENIIRVSGNGSLAGRHDRKDQLLEALCRFLVIENLKPAYDQFSEGLGTLGLLSALKKDSLTLEPFFIHQDKTLTAEDIFSLYRRTLSSEDGSNRKKKEDETVSWWRDMVLDMEDEGTLPALLSFLTGLDEIPPLGFEYEGSISFRHSADLSPNDSTREFPLINTCSLELRLPILDSYDIYVQRFRSAMTVETFTLY